MNNKTAIVGAVGLGAALMYFLDPDRGKRRRALVRDKVESAGNKATEYAEKMGRDVRNRAYGVVAETKSILKGEGVTDDVLVDRVRAKLGRYPVQMGAISVQANDGTVTLSGPISATELPAVLRATKFVRGVKAVDNQLTVHPEPATEPSLPGEPSQLGAPAT
jgi:osmotically-inducible protein OsmY